MDFSEEMHDEILKIFQVESEEIISKLNNSLLDLEKNPNNKDAILMLFRDAHTLKGASRMVGLTNIQTLAHKMEDVLGLTKENEIQLNSKIVDVLYKSVDLLSELIRKSIKKGKEVYSESIAEHINTLENIKDLVEEPTSDTQSTDFDADEMAEKIKETNELISESLYTLMKIDTTKNNELIAELHGSISKLYEIFKQTGPYDIKKLFEDIKVKLEFTIRGTNNLTVDETHALQQTLDNIINKLISICELYNFEVIDYYSQAFEKIGEGADIEQAQKPIIEETVIEIISEVETETPPSPEETPQVAEVFEQRKTMEAPPTPSKNFSIIKEKLDLLSDGNASISEITGLLEQQIGVFENKNIKNILDKISQILAFSEENETQLDEDTFNALKQSVEYCENLDKKIIDESDAELMIQRLEIIKQVQELSAQGSEAFNVIPSKHKLKAKKISDFSDIFNTGEIKTLRVDSTKLDSLVNQVGELTITKIKTKKHLQELDMINKNMHEWQKSSTKALNYLKHYDKKYMQTDPLSNQTSFFVKQMLNIFTDNNKRVQEALNSVATLHKTVQENDTKMSVIVDNLDNMVKNIRVLPLATVFHLFGRMVRDIAAEKNKKIDFQVLGSETSTDKKIIEEIKTPLIHIIRNAIDHGIEIPEERIALGKDPAGKIVLSARQSGNKVVIEIHDDGRGLNLEKIKEKAVQKGFLSKEEASSLTDEQISNLIFSPGFSTGEEITNISGRGIGLDVVQSKISQLNGKVKVISEVNRGCCVQIELPTTMSTLMAFLVKSAEQTFAVPMDVIKKVLRKNSDEIIANKGRRSIVFREKTVPLYDLADILNLKQKPAIKTRETILIIGSDENTIAISVDKLIGDQEILHKKLSAPFYKLKNISGITTLVSGEVCLILNISDIMKTISSSKVILNSAQPKLIKNSSYKILLVDDSITTRTMEKNILSKLGYTIETAQNPLEAFEKMKGERYDLIISDIEMPEMNGFEFLQSIKTNEMYADIPVIMLSSLSDDTDKNKAQELGAVKYIVKGEFDQDELQETISRIFNPQ